MSKLETPEWILKGEKPPKGKKKAKSFRVKKCPECGSTGVEIILGGEEGRGNKGWECKSCNWKGRDVVTGEVSEEEFMKHPMEKGE